MKIWLIFIILLNIFEPYNQGECESRNIRKNTLDLIDEFCNQAKVDDGHKCVKHMEGESTLDGCIQESCPDCTDVIPTIDKFCNDLTENGGFMNEFEKFLDKKCRTAEVSDEGICVYDISSDGCHEIFSCDTMFKDKCNEFKLSDINKICKLNSDGTKCEITDKPKKLSKASFLNGISLINIFILFL